MDSTIGRRQRSGSPGSARRWLAVLGVAALVLAGCSDSDDDETTLPAPTSTTVAVAPPGVQLEGPVNIRGTEIAAGVVAMEADNFYFGPTFVEATANLEFKIDLNNEGSVPHTFTSDILGVNQTLAPGEKKEVEVTAPPSGFTVFYCSFHRGQGMQGAIFVV